MPSSHFAKYVIAMQKDTSKTCANTPLSAIVYFCRLFFEYSVTVLAIYGATSKVHINRLFLPMRYFLRSPSQNCQISEKSGYDEHIFYTIYFYFPQCPSKEWIRQKSHCVFWMWFSYCLIYSLNFIENSNHFR